MKKNRVGETIGILKIEEYLGRNGYEIYYKAKCLCGNEIVVTNFQINRGKQSCGCLGSVNYETEVTDELLVSVEKETAIVMLMTKGMNKKEATEYYEKFRKNYLKDKTWL